jgi:hypothetical protein
MFAEKEFFREYTPVTHKYVTIGGNNHMDVTRIGSVVFKAKLGGRRSSVVLNNAPHVPMLRANLVSLGMLQHEGATVGSYKEGLLIQVEKEELFQARLTGTSGTLYTINCVESNTISAYFSSGRSMRLWHCHLGHLNIDYV